MDGVEKTAEVINALNMLKYDGLWSTRGRRLGEIDGIVCTIMTEMVTKRTKCDGIPAGGMMPGMKGVSVGWPMGLGRPIGRVCVCPHSTETEQKHGTTIQE